MPRRNYHACVRRTYLIHMLLRSMLDAPDDIDAEALTAQLIQDLQILNKITNTRYLRARNRLPKAGNLHLAFTYAQNPSDYIRFTNMLRISPHVFHVLLSLIEDHQVFFNNSNVPQTPIEIQLAVTLFRMGRFGNAASLEDIARNCGISEGSVEKFTNRCFDAIEALHDTFVRLLTTEEKLQEKQWMVHHLGFNGLWKEGWIMYDGTIVVLYSKPGLNGDAYYTRKGNYGLNAQVCLCSVRMVIILISL